jgi:hypothetical protein
MALACIKIRTAVADCILQFSVEKTAQISTLARLYHKEGLLTKPGTKYIKADAKALLSNKGALSIL